ncbi:uncharacterized protein LOC135712885 [Ochlerotatus camptorhynchus]|uniref:uncharacterized protein LOC135712885 n=1 Tax=Ochlerotatus camptorhynchus TaxID=644619 RepID=UPI0031CFA8F6
MKPTHLLARMQDLAAGLNVDDGLMKMLFLQRLPANVKTVLMIHDDTLTKLESSYTHPSVAATTSQPAFPTQEDLVEQIAYLTAEIRKLKGISRGKNLSRSSSRVRQSVNEPICWYHKKYGVNAYQCREPCVFKNSPKN